MINIENIFKDNAYFHFGIGKIEFNCDERNPKIFIEIGHYRNKKVLTIEISELIYHGVTNESHIYFDENEQWLHNVIISEAKNSKLVKSLGIESYLSVQFDDDLSDLKHYKIYAQNFIIDVLTTETPKMSIKENITID